MVIDDVYFNKIAANVVERVRQYYTQKVGNKIFGTFHSFGANFQLAYQAFKAFTNSKNNSIEEFEQQFQVFDIASQTYRPENVIQMMKALFNHPDEVIRNRAIAFHHKFQEPGIAPTS